MSIKNFVNKAKRAPKKDKIWAIACFLVALGLLVWFVVSLF